MKGERTLPLGVNGVLCRFLPEGRDFKQQNQNSAEKVSPFTSIRRWKGPPWVPGNLKERGSVSSRGKKALWFYFECCSCNQWEVFSLPDLKYNHRCGFLLCNISINPEPLHWHRLPWAHVHACMEREASAAVGSYPALISVSSST